MRRELIYKTFSNIPPLETERLLLRRLQALDAVDMFDYARRGDVTRYLTWSPHPSVAYTREYLEYVETRYDAGEFFDWALEERSSGRMIGTCGFTGFDYRSDCGEVGYVLNPCVWGHGYATEALRAVIAFGFEQLKLHRIEARYVIGNAASRHVMERVGMTYEGTLRGAMLIKHEHCDIGICAVVRG